MRPLDADEVLKKVLSIPPYCGHCDGYGFVQLDMVEDAIKDAPTIEAEPVKHGRWIGTHDGWYYSYSCSECGIEALTKEETMHDQVCSAYCPNCGAKMDLEGEG